MPLPGERVRVGAALPGTHKLRVSRGRAPGATPDDLWYHEADAAIWPLFPPGGARRGPALRTSPERDTPGRAAKLCHQPTGGS